MRWLVAILLTFLFLPGCSSLQPVELSPEQLQTKIRSGEIISTGDKVQVVTADGQHHEFKVTALTDTLIEGKKDQVAIEDVVALETSEFSGGKTALLVGSSVIVYQLLAAVAIAATVGL